jgi:hypothetical protein
MSRGLISRGARLADATQAAGTLAALGLLLLDPVRSATSEIPRSLAS